MKRKTYTSTTEQDIAAVNAAALAAIAVILSVPNIGPKETITKINTVLSKSSLLIEALTYQPE